VTKLQINQDSNILSELPYDAPKGYYYEVEHHKRGWKSIWLCGGPTYNYRNGTSARTIHSFYEEKTKKCYAPINSKKAGEEVNINNTRPWTSMKIKLNPLMAAFN